MDDLLRQIGNRILSRRKQLHMTQEELAEKAGITPQTVSSAELRKTSSGFVLPLTSVPITCSLAK